MRKSGSFLEYITILVFLYVFPSFVFAESSPLCNDLAKFSCAPGSYEDGTGKVKSESEISRFMASYGEKTRVNLRRQFEILLKDPSNSYFKDLASAGFGLKDSPQCTSADPNQIAACQENLLDGLTMLAQKYTLGRFMPTSGLERSGNLQGWYYIVNDNAFEKVIERLNKKIKKDFGFREIEQKIENKIFPKIKELIIARLKKISMPDNQRNLMIDKVRAISFKGVTCEEFMGGGGGITKLLLLFWSRMLFMIHQEIQSNYAPVFYFKVTVNLASHMS